MNDSRQGIEADEPVGGVSEDVRRLVAVYGDYDRSRAVAARRDPEQPGNRLTVAERNLRLTDLLRRARHLPWAGGRVLDVGCGRGTMLSLLMRLGVPARALHGIDLLPDRVDSARASLSGVDCRCCNAQATPFPDGHFDLVLLLTVFSSIRSDHVSVAVARECSRVLRKGPAKPGGPWPAVAWYDLGIDNPLNPHVRGIPPARVRRLFPEFDCRLAPITLCPPLARGLGPFAPFLYPLLSSLPALRTHFAGILVRQS